jgi:anti-anti-sigma factor
MTQVWTGAGHALLRLSGDLDVASADALRAVLDDQLAAGRPTIEIHVAEVRFCDAAGLGVLIAAQQRFRAIGGGLRLIDVSAAMARLLSITGLTDLFAPD